MQTAKDTLEVAVFSRGVGDVDACVRLATAALRQAEFENDPDTAYRAVECVGRMYMGRGEACEAVAPYRHALDLTKLHGLKHREAGAYHDLALAVRETGDRRQFKELAACALHLYDRDNPRDTRITGLLADMAADVFERCPNDLDCAAAALATWWPVSETMRTPHYRLTGAAQAMVTTAVLKYDSRYNAACGALDRLYAAMPDNESVPLILAYAAGGALQMRDFRKAAQLAECAERIGTARNESKPVEDARAVLEAALAEKTGVRT